MTAGIDWLVEDMGMPSGELRAYILMRVARRRGLRVEDQEDVCQEVLIHVHRVYPAVREKWGGRHPNVAAWLELVVSRLIIDWLRRKHGRVPDARPSNESLDQMIRDPEDESNEDPVERIVIAELGDTLRGKLSKSDLEHLHLRYIEEHGFAEMVAKLDCGTPGACRTHHVPKALQRARVALAGHTNIGDIHHG